MRRIQTRYAEGMRLKYPSTASYGGTFEQQRADSERAQNPVPGDAVAHVGVNAGAIETPVISIQGEHCSAFNVERAEVATASQGSDIVSSSSSRSSARIAQRLLQQ